MAVPLTEATPSGSARDGARSRSILGVRDGIPPEQKGLNGREGERVGHVPCCEKVLRSFERDEHQLALFGLVELRCTGRVSPFREEGVTDVALQSGVGVDTDQRGEPARVIACLLPELAARGLFGQLAPLDDPARQLQRKRVGSEPVLPDEHELRSLGDGDDVAPIGAVEGCEWSEPRSISTFPGSFKHIEHSVLGHAASREAREGSKAWLGQEQRRLAHEPELTHPFSVEGTIGDCRCEGQNSS